MNRLFFAETLMAVLSGGQAAVTGLVWVAVLSVNPGYGEERPEPVVTVFGWADWKVIGLVVLLGAAILLAGLALRLRTVRFRNVALEQTVTQLEQEVRALTQSLQVAELTAAQLERSVAVATQARSVFLTSISHELCTPLNGILGYATILRKQSTLDSTMADGLDVIIHSGQRLESLINDLLDGVRIASGQLVLHPEPLNTCEFVAHIKNLVQPKADIKGLALSVSITSEVPGVVLADEARLRQVVLHLLENAVRNTERGSVTLTVEAMAGSAWERGNVCIRFAIDNSGTGIDPDQLKQADLSIEQPVFDAQDTELRLMICHRIIQKMGGVLQVETTPAPTSRVWFALDFPVVATPNRERQVSIGEAKGYEGKRRTILVVDDKPYNRQLLKAMLNPLGFDVLMAENGREAVDKAIECRPDAILMDLVMPVMSGFEAVQAIRQQPGLASILIIAVSASVSDTGRKESLEVGFDAYLAKPIRIEKILGLVGDSLALRWVYSDAGKDTNDKVVAPPMEELVLLHRLSEEGQVYEIQKRVMALERRDGVYGPFCQHILELTKNFELERISTVVGEYLD